MPAWKRNISIFLAGQSATTLGSMLVSFAVMWHLTLRTQSGAVMMAVIVFGMMPQALVSLYGGSWADRYNRKALLIGANVGTAVTTLTLALMLHAGIEALWVFYLTMAVRSALQGVLQPAANAIIPGLVPTGQLMRINGISESIGSAAMLIAPLFAGAFYENIGLVPIFLVDVGASLAAVLFLAFLPTVRVVADDADAEQPAGGLRVLCDLRVGLRYVARHQTVRWLMLVYAVAMAMAAAPAFLTPLMMARTFGPDVWRLTANEMFWAAGSLLAGLTMAAIGHRLKRHLRIIVGALVLTGVLTIALGLAGNMWLYLALVFAVATAFSAITIPEFTMLQQTVDPTMMGRVFGLVSIITSVSMSLAMGVMGPLADHVSVESLLVVSGALLVVVIAGLLGFRSLRSLLAAQPSSVPREDLARPQHPHDAQVAVRDDDVRPAARHEAAHVA